MNHKEKVKLARRLRTPEELKRGVPIFATRGWFYHHIAVHNRVVKKQMAAFKRSVVRQQPYIWEPLPQPQSFWRRIFDRFLILLKKLYD